MTQQEYNREYHAKNKGKRNLQSTEYRKKHIVELKEYWKKENAEDYANIQSERIKTKESGCVLCGYNLCDLILVVAR